MFAPTTHFQQAARRARDQRKLDVALVLLTGLAAIAAGLAMSALSSLGMSVGFLPV